MKGIALALFCATGCGRIGFAERPGDANGDGNDGTDAPIAPAERVQAIQQPFVRAPTITIPITHAADHLLIVGVYWNVSALQITVTDLAGLAWQGLPIQASPCADECGETVEAIFFARSTSALDNMITVTQSMGSVCPFGAFVLDYSGLSGTVLDTTGAIAPAASNMAAAPPIHPTRDAVLVAMYTDGVSTGTIVPGPGFTTAGVDAVWHSMIATADNVPAGSYMPTATLPTTDACWTASVAAFAVGP